MEARYCWRSGFDSEGASTIDDFIVWSERQIIFSSDGLRDARGSCDERSESRRGLNWWVIYCL